MAKPHPPAGEASLRAIAGRYALTESEVRDLLAEAPSGDRDSLLNTALGLIDALRAEDTDAAMDEAYIGAHDSARKKLEGRAVENFSIAPLAESLAQKLTDALDEAAKRAKHAFGNVTEDNLDEMSQEAVTAKEYEDGRKMGLAGYGLMTTSTLGRRATTRGTLDAVGAGQVQFSSHGSHHPVCSELEGQVFSAFSAPEPPIHEGCQHTLIPLVD